MIISFFLPAIIDASNWIEFFPQNSEHNFENTKYYFMLKAGNLGYRYWFYAFCS